MTAVTPTTWKRRFCERTAQLREARGWTQPQMAEALGIPLERYKKYETRSPLPHWLIARFVLIVDTDADQLFAVDRPPTKRKKADTGT